ncbi:MAG: hypothetical protein M1546_22665, partial [Chloroflexi bacterium]|nr:hypothetical protein [Chloroflexota bacterium]
VVRRAIGRGIVDQLAFDPTLAPVRDWPDRRLIFAALFGGRVGYSSVLGPLRADFNVANAARALPSAALPPFLVVAGFLLLYVLTIGPINFFFLRKLNRLSWAWLTIPATVVLFALLGTATGFRLRGNEPQVHRLSIISGDAYIEDGRAQSIVGLFAPRRTVLDVTTDNNLAEEVQPDPNLQSRLDFLFSSPNRLADVIVTNNDVRTFYLRGEAKLPHIEADLDLIPGNSAAEVARIMGEVRNESLALLRDCVLVAGRDYRVIGDIGPNAHVPAEIRLLLNRPQMSMVPPATRLSAASYSSSISTGAGRSGLSSAA